MKTNTLLALLAGIGIGAGVTGWLMSRSTSSTIAPAPEGGPSVSGGNSKGRENEPDLTGEFVLPGESSSTGGVVLPDESMEWLVRFSGKWVSADGQQSAELDDRMLRFEETPGWPDLNRKTFLLGREEMQFLSDAGIYSLRSNGEGEDAIRLIKRDLVTNDLSGLTLYREGTEHARSLSPLPVTAPPERIQRMLDAISSIKKGEKKDVVMKRLCPVPPGSLEILGGESGLGETDLLLNLNEGGEWVLKLKYGTSRPGAPESDAVILRFQIVRTVVDAAREGEAQVETMVYPYYAFGKIVTGPGKFESAPETGPIAPSDSK